MYALLSTFFIFYFIASARTQVVDSVKKSKILSDLAFTRLSETPNEDHSSWSEVVVVRMYYDCKGQLMQQKISTLRTRNDIEDEKPKENNELQPKESWRFAPIEEEMVMKYLRSMREKLEKSPNPFKEQNSTPDEAWRLSPIEEKMVISYLRSLRHKLNTIPKPFKEENPTFKKQGINQSQSSKELTNSTVENALSGVSPSDDSQPKVFRSMPGRFKQPKDALGNSEAQKSSPVRFAKKPKVEVKPDSIIDTPIIPCAEGMNEGLTGDCRPIF